MEMTFGCIEGVVVVVVVCIWRFCMQIRERFSLQTGGARR